MSRRSIHEEIKERSRRRRGRMKDAVEVPSATTIRNDLLPKLALTMWKITDLRTEGRSVRKLLPAQVEAVKTSMGRFGVVQPLQIRSDGRVIKGKTRLEAARQLGLVELPCIEIDHLNEAEVRALTIALGRLPERGEWDFDELRLELKDLIELNAPIESLGFTLTEIDALILDDDPSLDFDRAPNIDRENEPVSAVGDVWLLGDHRLVCGDARDPRAYETLLEGRQARLVFTDEPYNVPILGHVTCGSHKEFAMASGEMSRAEFRAFNSDWMKLCKDQLVPSGILGTFIDWRSIQLVLSVAEELGLELLNVVVWAKTNAGMGSLYRSQHELFPLLKKEGAPHVNNVNLGKYGRWRSNLWTYPGASSLGSDARDGLAGHPTVKPVALIEDALLDITQFGEIVLEPFAGSGSTLIACETTNRHCRAIELDPHYVDLIVRRWQKLTGMQALHEAKGYSFDEIEAMSQITLVVEASDEH